MPASNWEQYWRQAKQEWQSNNRLQAISMLAAVLFLLWFHVQLNDWRLAKKADANAALTAFQDTQTVARENQWLERAKLSGDALQLMRKKLWRATSEGEAEAKLRDWIQTQARDAGITVTRILIEMAPAPRGFIWRPVHVDIQGQYQAGAWQLLVDKMVKGEPPVIIDFEQLNVANPNNLFFRLNVTAWFVISETAGGQ